MSIRSVSKDMGSLFIRKPNVEKPKGMVTSFFGKNHSVLPPIGLFVMYMTWCFNYAQQSHLGFTMVSS